jgi:uncharacterized damage-inducible protein DinB
MNLEHLMRDYAGYNLWANTKITNWLKEKPQSILKQSALSSYSSIESTVFHILYAENEWATRLKYEDARFNPTMIYQKSTGELFAEFIQQSKELSEYVANLSGSDLTEDVSFSVPGFGEFSMKRFEMLQQCFNHSTYHRGQIVTLGRNLKITDAPATDYFFYLEEKKSAGEII